MEPTGRKGPPVAQWQGLAHWGVALPPDKTRQDSSKARELAPIAIAWYLERREWVARLPSMCPLRTIERVQISHLFFLLRPLWFLRSQLKREKVQEWEGKKVNWTRCETPRKGRRPSQIQVQGGYGVSVYATLTQPFLSLQVVGVRAYLRCRNSPEFEV